MTRLSFDGQQVYRHTKYLSVDIGSRVMGSAGGKRAADYIRDYFDDLGLKTWDQTFDVEYEVLQEHSVKILEPPLGEITSGAVMLTPNTPEEGLTGKVVFVEGSQEPQIGPHIIDKIVLWSAPFEPRALLKYHPLAVIGIGPNQGVGVRYLHMPRRRFGPYEPVPTFWITWEDGLRLVQAGVKKAQVQLRSQRQQGVGRNIIAELKGSERPDEIVVICGHYDTVPDVAGATDNASGVAVVMELARLYARRGSKRTLRFIAWDAEEGGYAGSTYYARTLWQQDKVERALDEFVIGRDKTELDRHLFCLNVDTVGMALGQDVCYVLGSSEIAATINVLGKELGVPHQLKPELDSTDYLPFAWVGIPAIGFVREGQTLNYIHTVADTIDLIDISQLQRVGILVDTFLTRTAANAQVWPFERRIPGKQKQAVDEQMKDVGWSLEA